MEERWVATAAMRQRIQAMLKEVHGGVNGSVTIYVGEDSRTEWRRIGGPPGAYWVDEHANIFNLETVALTHFEWDTAADGLLVIVRRAVEDRRKRQESNFLTITDPSLWGPDAS